MIWTRCIALLTLFALTACGAETTSSEQGSGAADPPAQAETGTLQAKLDARKAEWARNADARTKTLYDEGIKRVVASGVYDTMKKVGDTAPGFMLPDAEGQPVVLSDLLDQGPVIVVFYRGAWCPYCNLTLAQWQAHTDEIEALGATLVAISPQVTDFSMKSKQSNGLTFPVLSDVGSETSDAYGITTLVTPEILALWEGKFDLAEHNGEEGAPSGKLPLAATYLIDTDGKIRYAFADAEYRNRAEPEKVLAELRAIEAK